MFQASAVLFFACVGFDAVSTMAEETKNPARDIPIGLVGSMVITTLAYCLLAMTLCLMQPYANVDKDARYSVAFQAVGMSWAKYKVALGALEGMTSVLLVGAVGQARYPLVPWLPSVSIAINFFLLGSIDKASYLRHMDWNSHGLLFIFRITFVL